MEAKCKYYGKCGGCTLQHIDYSIQLENKKNNLIKTINFENIEVYSGKDYNYRNRMDMLFTEKGIGFRKKGTWKEMLDVDECVISNNRLNELIKELREFFRENDAFNPVKHTGTFRYAVIRTPTEDSSISFVLNSDSMKLEQASEKIREFSEKTTAKNIVVTYVESNTDVSLSEEYYVVKGTEYLKEKYLGKEFTYQGKKLEELKQLSLSEFANLLPSRERRTILRSGTLIEKFLKRCNKKSDKEKNIRTHNRDIIIVPKLVGLTISIHNGKEFTQIIVTEEMIGHRLGEFTQTRSRVQHGAPGIGATRGSAFLSVK